MSDSKLPPGVREWGRKFKACIPSKRNHYVGTFDTVADAVQAQADYRKEKGLPEPKIGRPKKNMCSTPECENKTEGGIINENPFCESCIEFLTRHEDDWRPWDEKINSTEQ